MARYLTPVIEALGQEQAPTTGALNALLDLTRAQYCYQEECQALHTKTEGYQTLGGYLVETAKQELQTLHCYIQELQGLPTSPQERELTLTSTSKNPYTHYVLGTMERTWERLPARTAMVRSTPWLGDLWTQHNCKKLQGFSLYLYTHPYNQSQDTIYGHDFTLLATALEEAEKQLNRYKEHYKEYPALKEALQATIDSLKEQCAAIKNAKKGWELYRSALKEELGASAYPFFMSPNYHRGYLPNREATHLLTILQDPDWLIDPPTYRPLATSYASVLALDELHLLQAHQQRLLLATQAQQAVVAKEMAALQVQMNFLTTMEEVDIPSRLEEYSARYATLEAYYQDLQCYGIMARQPSTMGTQEDTAYHIKLGDHYTYDELTHEYNQATKQAVAYMEHYLNKQCQLQVLAQQAKTFAHAPLLQDLLYVQQRNASAGLHNLEMAHITLQNHADHLQETITWQMHQSNISGSASTA